MRAAQVQVSGELVGDGLTDLVAHGHHPHAGQALGFGLEAAAELDHLGPGYRLRTVRRPGRAAMGAYPEAAAGQR